MMPVTQELLDDAGDLHGSIHRRIRIFLFHWRAAWWINEYMIDRYGPHTRPEPFDPTRLRPPLPFWPRPGR